MSKKVLILLAGGILAIIASIFLLKYEMNKAFDDEFEPEPEPEPEDETAQDPEPEPEPVKNIVTGPREGYFYNKHSKAWEPCKTKVEPAPGLKATPAEYLKPEPVILEPVKDGGQ